MTFRSSLPYGAATGSRCASIPKPTSRAGSRRDPNFKVSSSGRIEILDRSPARALPARGADNRMTASKRRSFLILLAYARDTRADARDGLRLHFRGPLTVDRLRPAEGAQIERKIGDV